jgi:uncharacterized protein (TIGR02391 family)
LWPKSRHAAEIVAELDEWAADHMEFLQVVWAEFSEHNAWPVAAELTRRLPPSFWRAPIAVRRSSARAPCFRDAVQQRSGITHTDGDDLMNLAFSPKRPRLAVADLETTSGHDIQRGTHLIALGIVAAIRNPIAHGLVDPGLSEAVEQLSILSFVARRLDDAIVVNDEE